MYTFLGIYFSMCLLTMTMTLTSDNKYDDVTRDTISIDCDKFTEAKCLNFQQMMSDAISK